MYNQKNIIGRMSTSLVVLLALTINSTLNAQQAPESTMVNIAGGAKSLYWHISAQKGFNDFERSLTEEENERLMKIEGYPSRDRQVFYLIKPINLIYASDAFSFTMNPTAIEAANMVNNAYKAYAKAVATNTKSAIGLFDKNIVLTDSKESIEERIRKSLAALKVNSAALDDFITDNIKTTVKVASAMTGLPVNLEDASFEEINLLVSKFLMQSVIKMQIPIAPGFSKEDSLLLAKVAKHFGGASVVMYDAGETWKWAQNPNSEGIKKSQLGWEAQKMLEKFKLNSLLEVESVLGLQGIEIGGAGATIQLDLPYFTVVGWGLDPEGDVMDQLKDNIEILYHIPGTFIQERIIPIGLTGNLHCTFDAKVIEKRNYYGRKDADDRFVDNSSAPTQDISVRPLAKCILKAIVDGKEEVLSDDNGNLNIASPLLVKALGVADVAKEGQEQAIRRLERIVQSHVVNYQNKYSERFQAAKSLKDAYIDSAMFDFEAFKQLPVPEVQKTKDTWTQFTHCYESTTQQCKYVAKHGFCGKACGVKHKCWDVKEPKCDQYHRFVRSYYTQKVPQVYFKNASFEKIFNEENIERLSISDSYRTILGAANRLCLSYKTIGSRKVAAPCGHLDIMVEEITSSEDTYTSQGLGSVVAEETFDAPISGKDVIDTVKISL